MVECVVVDALHLALIGISDVFLSTDGSVVIRTSNHSAVDVTGTVVIQFDSLTLHETFIAVGFMVHSTDRSVDLSADAGVGICARSRMIQSYVLALHFATIAVGLAVHSTNGPVVSRTRTDLLPAFSIVLLRHIATNQIALALVCDVIHTTNKFIRAFRGTHTVESFAGAVFLLLNSRAFQLTLIAVGLPVDPTHWPVNGVANTRSLSGKTLPVILLGCVVTPHPAFIDVGYVVVSTDFVLFGWAEALLLITESFVLQIHSSRIQQTLVGIDFSVHSTHWLIYSGTSSDCLEQAWLGED